MRDLDIGAGFPSFIIHPYGRINKCFPKRESHNKEDCMRNIIRLFGIIALVAIIGFGFAACESLGSILSSSLSGDGSSGHTNYAIGDTGPGGGIVFHDKGNDNDGWRFLEAAPEDVEGRFTWATPSWGSLVMSQEGREGRAIGMGKVNTATILSLDPNAPAAKACVDYRGGGFDDWFLPSSDELLTLYQQNSLLKLSEDRNYWSSSQWGDSSFDAFSPSVNRIAQWRINSEYSVRPVRAFLTSTKGALAVEPYAPLAPPPAPEPVRFEPAQNQPSPVGVWKQEPISSLSTTYTFNANGTGNQRYYSENRAAWVTNDLRWSVSGNRLTINYTSGGDATVYIFEITGNTLKWVDSRWPTYAPEEYTRQ
jgi:hypothetical protein